MENPDWENAYVPRPKIVDYLLSETHPIGRSKARFLQSVGFNKDDAEALESGLMALARSGVAADANPSPFGRKFTIEGLIQSPDGHTVRLMTIWIVEKGQSRPRFVTAYPI